VSYFGYATVAERYAAFRPYHQPAAMKRIRERLGLTEGFTRALDVGCGTGNSTAALAAIAQTAIGTDVSAPMLAVARQAPNVAYVRAAAESLPFEPATFAAVTSCSSLHWFAAERFLPEAARVLEPGGWLIVYGGDSVNGMRGVPAYWRWSRDVYHARYPRMPHQNTRAVLAGADRFGLSLVGRDDYQSEHAFTVEELACSLTTHSNVIAAVEEGTESLESVYRWLLDELRPMFSAPRETFDLDGSITYLRVAPDRG
jgi:SAM-dependent methyltransferase